LVWFIVYRVVLYENSHGSTGKSFFFSHYDDVFSGLLTNWFYDHRSSSIQFRDHGSTLSALHVSAISCLSPPLYWGRKLELPKIMLGAIGGNVSKKANRTR
jgi:hypothetical protein